MKKTSDNTHSYKDRYNPRPLKAQEAKNILEDGLSNVLENTSGEHSDTVALGYPPQWRTEVFLIDYLAFPLLYNPTLSSLSPD